MDDFTCPYCNRTMSLHTETYNDRTVSFHSNTGLWPQYDYEESAVKIMFVHCPKCKEYSIAIQGIGKSVENYSSRLKPKSLARQFSDYIPEAIRSDYEEAYSIVDLSPKASATLSRRCLQGMIRDFWKIQESNLSKSINQLEGKIPAQQWRVLDGVRRIGNIGAHMEKDISLIIDIEPDEATRLLKLIEHLLEQWYINRHEQELLYSEIIEIDESKQTNRKKTE